MVAPLWGKPSYILSSTANATCQFFFFECSSAPDARAMHSTPQEKGRVMLADWDAYPSESQSKRIEMESQAHGPL